MATELKPGDIVRLKSGGPAMTVTAIGEHAGETKALCEWFDGTKLTRTILFWPHSNLPALTIDQNHR